MNTTFLEAILEVENHPEFIAKAMESEDNVPPSKKANSRRFRGNSWQRKREHKKKIVRQFLSINPAMDYSEFGGTRCRPAIYINFFLFEDGEFYDPRTEYCFNPYTKIFLSQRGDLRKYRGLISCARSGTYSLTTKDRDIARITNKRIRKLSPEEVTASFSYLKKACGPWVDYGW